MEDQALCSDCFVLLQTGRTSAHKHLTEKNHIYNDTLFECNNCQSVLRLTHVPHQWNIVDKLDLEETSIQSA